MLALHILLVFCFCLIQSAVHCNTFNWIIKTSIPEGVRFVEYSADQKYLALVSDQSLRLNEGVTIYFRSNMNPLGFNITSFTFSQDSSKIAVGLRKQSFDVTSYMIYNTTAVPSQEQIQKLISIRQQNDIDLYKIVSMCFTGDNSRLVYGTTEGKIYIYNIAKDVTTELVFSIDVPVLALACSPFRSLQFVAAGSAEAKKSKMSLFSIDPVSNIATESYNFANINLDEAISDLTFSKSGNYLYRSGSLGLYKTDINTYESQTLTFPADLKDFQKIRVSNKEDVLVASTKDNRIYISKTIPNTNQNQQQNFTASSPAFGLTPFGSNIFYIQNPSMGTLLSQCKRTQYFNDADNTCNPCGLSCDMCFDTPTQCHSCKQAHYLIRGFECLQCMPRCKSCFQANVCSICYDPFIRKNQTCGCADGNFIDGNVCSACTSNCKTCSNSISCQTCTDTFDLDENKKCFCQKGKYVDQNLCVSCAQSCLQCADFMHCHQCAEDFKLENGLCVKSGFPVWAIVLLVSLGFIMVLGLVVVLCLRHRRNKKSILLSTDEQHLDD